MFNLIEYIGFSLYSVVSRILPLGIAYRLADLIGYLVFRFRNKDCKCRAGIMQNIYKGKIDFYSAKKLVCRNIQIFNRDMVIFFRSGRLNKGNIDAFAEISGIEHLDNAIKNGNGVILASAHMGSWEMSGIILVIKDYPVYGMIWEEGNKRVSDMFSKIRSKKGLGSVEISHLRHILELLQKNKIIGIMLDVDGGSKGIPYSVWGYNVRLPRGPAAISRDIKAELLIMIALRNKNGGYKLYIEKPKIDGTEEEITIGIFEIIKNYIERDPVQWHWIRYFFKHK